MSEAAPAPAPVEATSSHSGMHAMEAAAADTIITNAENASIAEVREADLKSAEAAHKAAVAAVEAKAAEKSAALTAEKAAKAVAETKAREAADAARSGKTKAIEKRSNSSDVSALNDKAELELYGSKGNTFKDAEGNVIASPDKRLKGKIEDIMTNPKYGKTPEERAKKAEAYTAQLDQLTRTNTETIKRFKTPQIENQPLEVKEIITPGEGLELTQAKLVLDMREQDLTNESKLMAKYVADGMDPAEALKKAEKFYDLKDAARLKLIKENGVFSMDDYTAALKGKELYPGEAAAVNDVPTPEVLKPIPLPPIVEQTPPVNPGHTGVTPGMEIELWQKPGELVPYNEALNGALNELSTSRAEFVRLSMKRRGKSVGTKAELADAKAKYDNDRNQAGGIVAAQLKAAGVDQSVIDAFGKDGNINEAEALNAASVALAEKQAGGKKFKKFYDTWARLGGRKENGKRNWAGTLAKVGIMAGVTALPAAGLATLIGGVIASTGAGAGFAAIGGVLSNRIGKGLLGAKINKNANAVSVAHKQGDFFEADAKARLGGRESIKDASEVSDIFQEQTDKINKRNKLRHVGAIALAVGGAAGGYGLHHLISGGGGGNHVRGVVDSNNHKPISGAPVDNGGHIPGTPSRPALGPEDIKPTTLNLTPANPNAIPSGLIDTSKWKYPYQWVQDNFKGNATDKIHALEAAAQKAGHKVVLHNAGTKTEWISIDGNSSTPYVVNILNSFK